MKVTKMHALGNNYIYVSEFEEALDPSTLSELAIAVSDIRRGIGSDGLILIGPSSKANVRMRIFNADGSESENCGNGLRCVAKYAYEHGYVDSSRFTIEVKTGVVEAHVFPNDENEVHRVTIDMGAATFGADAVGYVGHAALNELDQVTYDVNHQIYSGMLVSMGNPHFVTCVEDATGVNLSEVGPVIERHEDFPRRINVEFVTPKGRSELDFRVWERGSGVTLACGTGACASVAAGIRLGYLDDKVTVHLQGGDLEIEVKDGRVWMTGEAVEVFCGDFAWPR